MDAAVEFELPGQPLAYRPRPVRRVFGASLFVSLAMLALGAFVVLRVTSAVQTATTQVDVQGMVGQALSVVGTAVDLAAKAKSAGGGSLTGDVVPVRCGGNDHATITGKTLSLAAGVPVIASDNCTLTLVNCTVSGGASGIALSDNATVMVVGGSIAGKGPAVVLAGNSTLDVSNGARLSGEVTINASGNSQAKIRNSSVNGGHVAIHTSNAATVDTTGSTVEGQVLGKRTHH